MEYKHALQLNKLNEYSELHIVESVFNEFKPFYKNEIVLTEDSYLFRSRLENSKFNVKEKQELSYIKNRDNVKLGRANLEKKSVFYGSTNPRKTINYESHAIETAILEGSKKRREDNDNNFIEKGYLSRWMTTSQLKVFSFLNHDFGLNIHQDLKVMKDKVVENIRLKSPLPERDLEINHWIASVFAMDFKESNNDAYKISAWLADELMKNHDGVLYPSVQTNGVAVNIALTSESADTLRLAKVLEIDYFRNSGKPGIIWGQSVNIQ